MEPVLSNEDRLFFEYLQGGELPPGKEKWIALKAAIESATMRAFELAELSLCGYYGDNELARAIRF